MNIGRPIKDKLKEELWHPIIEKGGNVFYPRLRKNKNMKVLSLTTDTDPNDVIIGLVDKKLTKRERMTFWTHSHFKKIRLETDLAPSSVLGVSKYENAILSSTFSLDKYFPFDVINLDFSSQEPVFDPGRVEKEVISVGKTIRNQKNSGSMGFVLIYTTILNSNNLDLETIKNDSNDILTDLWSTILINQNSSNITDNDQKISCIYNILSVMVRKHEYNIQDYKNESLTVGEHKVLLSISMLLKHT